MRLSVLAAYDSGKPTRQVAKELGCSESWARRVKQTRNTPRFIFQRRTRRRVPRWSAYEEQIVALIESNLDMTLEHLKSALDTDLSLASLSRALQHLELSKSVRYW
jgi:transposase